jgi:autotransporter-associated beta strand protein
MRIRTDIWAGLAVITALSVNGPAVGQTYTWDGSTFDPMWIIPQNWVGNVTPNPGQNTVIQFAGNLTLNTNQNVGNPFELNQLVFTNTAGAFNLTGNPLLFRRNTSSSDPDLFQNSASAITIGNEIRLEANANLSTQGSGTGTVTLNGPIVGGSNTTIQKFGTYTLELGSANNTTWAGYLVVGIGTARTTATGALNGVGVQLTPDGVVDLNGFSQTIGSLLFFNDGVANTIGARVTTGSGTLTLGGTVTYTPAAIGATPYALISGNLNLGTTGTRTFNIGLQGGGPFEFTTDADIASGSGGVTKTGAGAWFARSGSWTFSGTTLISDGGIYAGAANVFSPNSTVSLSGDGLLSLRYLSGSTPVDSDQRIGGLSGTSTTSNVSLGSATLTVGANNASTSYAGSITGAGGRLVKVGTGTLTLTGSNSFSGGVEIQQGVVAVPTVSSLGSSAAPTKVSAGGQLRFTDNTAPGRTFDLTGGGAISVDATKTVSYGSSVINGGFLRGAGTHSLGSSTTVTGTTVLPGTPVTFGSGATLTNVTAGGTLTASGAGTRTWDGGFLTAAGQLTVNSGATVNTTAIESLGRIAVNPGGTINHTGTPLVLGGGSVTTVGQYNPSTGVVTAGGTINVGTGGTIVVQGGFLRNNGTITGGAGSTLIVDYGGVVKGIGEIDVASLVLRNGGQLQIGNSPGIIRIPNAGFNGSDSGVGAPVQGDLNNATGTVGGFPAAANGNTANSGWGAIEYGNSANTSGFLQLQRTVAGPVYWRYRTTVNDGIGNTPGAPANFSVTTGYTWTIFRPRTNSNDTGVPASGAGDQVNTVATVTLLDASGATLPNTDANLNQVLAFERSQFLNPATNLPVTPAEGTFSFAFAPDFVGRPNTVIQLVFTPVPEPATVLGVVMLVGAGVTGWRRWRAGKPAPTP